MKKKTLKGFREKKKKHDIFDTTWNDTSSTLILRENTWIQFTREEKNKPKKKVNKNINIKIRKRMHNKKRGADN